MAKARVSVSFEKVKFNFAYTCKKCKGLAQLCGHTMEGLRDARRLLGEQLCFDCDAKIEGRKRK